MSSTYVPDSTYTVFPGRARVAARLMVATALSQDVPSFASFPDSLTYTLFVDRMKLSTRALMSIPPMLTIAASTLPLTTMFPDALAFLRYIVAEFSPMVTEFPRMMLVALDANTLAFLITRFAATILLMVAICATVMLLAFTLARDKSPPAPKFLEIKLPLITKLKSAPSSCCHVRLPNASVTTECTCAPLPTPRLDVLRSNLSIFLVTIYI